MNYPSDTSIVTLIKRPVVILGSILIAVASVFANCYVPDPTFCWKAGDCVDACYDLTCENGTVLHGGYYASTGMPVNGWKYAGLNQSGYDQHQAVSFNANVPVVNRFCLLTLCACYDMATSHIVTKTCTTETFFGNPCGTFTADAGNGSSRRL